jgi:hypothetical protein
MIDDTRKSTPHALARFASDDALPLSGDTMADGEA